MLPGIAASGVFLRFGVDKHPHVPFRCGSKPIAQTTGEENDCVSVERAASPDASPESHVLRVELEEVVARAVTDLPEGLREVLILTHYEQMSIAEIAQVMEIEATTVKSRLQRARAQL